MKPGAPPLMFGGALIAFSVALCPICFAENLYSPNAPFANVTADRRADRVGDVITVVVYQNAEARNRAQNVSRQSRSFDGQASAGDTAESVQLGIDSRYGGEGEVRRSESFVTQISVAVEEVAANGDLIVAGQQVLHINGERTTVRVRGRVRPEDISDDNRVLSTRIAEAEISYDGRGFVSRNASPNWVHRLLSLLGLGG